MHSHDCQVALRPGGCREELHRLICDLVVGSTGLVDGGRSKQHSMGISIWIYGISLGDLWDIHQTKNQVGIDL